MSHTHERLRRLERTVPRAPEPSSYDLSRLSPDQLRRCVALNARTAAVGLAGLTDQEVDDGAVIAEILLAPEWPAPATDQHGTGRTT
jgi:hypothetical protein